MPNLSFFKAVKLGRYIILEPAALKEFASTALPSLASGPLVKAQTPYIRIITEISMEVSPLGHLTPIATSFDACLMQSPIIYAAAGTPIHVYGCSPTMM